jgi:hypothetical protein
MKPLTEKFEEFALISGQIPLLMDVLSADQLTEIIEGGLPDKLTDQVYSEMSEFPFDLVKKAQGMVFPVRSEIDMNVISIENDGQLKRYLKSIDYKVWSILGVLESLSYMETLKNRHVWLPELINSVGNKYQIVYDFLEAHLTHYNNFRLVQMHITEKLMDIEINSTRSITEIKEILLSNIKPASLRVHSDILTHREHALIYKYKADAGYIVPNSFSGAEIEKQFGAKRKQAFYSIWNEGGKTYKAPKVDELEKIIPYLVEHPLAQKAVINDLAKIN